MSKRLYLCPPHMSGHELHYVRKAFDTNWLSTVGPNIDAFEAEMGERLGRHCVALSSGTAAIHLALRLAGVGVGDEVLCPSLTFVASCNPIAYLGATPVFVDSEVSTWNIDPTRLEEAIEDRVRKRDRAPKALIVVHLYGQTASMQEIEAVARKYDIDIVEDAAEALGATYRGEAAGALAPHSALSFNGNKIITTSGGGMLVTDNEQHAVKARFWSTQARDPGIAYEHSEMGYNYRLSNVLAGIGRGQLAALDARIQKHREITFRYRDELVGHGLKLMPQADHGQHTNWLSVFTLDSTELRDRVITALDEANIESRPVWKPMHLQPLYRDAAMYGGNVSTDLFARGICLPSGTGMSDADQSRVIDTIAKALQ